MSEKKPLFASVSPAQLIAESSVIRLNAHIKRLFIVTLNTHITLKKLLPDSIIGDELCYEYLKFYGKCSLTLERKVEMLDKILNDNPEETEEWCASLAKLEAYNIYLQNMADFEMKHNMEFTVVDDSIQYL